MNTLTKIKTAVSLAVQVLRKRLRINGDAGLFFSSALLMIATAAAVVGLVVGATLVHGAQAFRVVSHRCDSGGVSALEIVVAEPTVVRLRWDNEDLCPRS